MTLEDPDVHFFFDADDTQDPEEDVQQLGRVKEWIRSYYLDTVKFTDVLSNFPDISVVKSYYAVVPCW